MKYYDNKDKAFWSLLVATFCLCCTSILLAFAWYGASIEAEQYKASWEKSVRECNDARNRWEEFNSTHIPETALPRIG